MNDSKNQRETDLIDVSGLAPPTPKKSPAPAAEATTPNQRFYRQLMAMQTQHHDEIRRWANQEREGELMQDETNVIHAQWKSRVANTEAATVERRMAELLKLDPTAAD